MKNTCRHGRKNCTTCRKTSSTYNPILGEYVYTYDDTSASGTAAYDSGPPCDTGSSSNYDSGGSSPSSYDSGSSSSSDCGGSY